MTTCLTVPVTIVEAQAITSAIADKQLAETNLGLILKEVRRNHRLPDDAVLHSIDGLVLTVNLPTPGDGEPHG